MRFEIVDNVFKAEVISYNKLFEEVKLCFPDFPHGSIYLRGSLFESIDHHPNADLDIYLLHNEAQVPRDAIRYIHDRLAKFGKIIDLHVLHLGMITDDRPNRLLLSCGSFHVTGPEIQFEPVRHDKLTIDSHWDTYNPEFPPDIMYSSHRSRVCALKNLTRCLGLMRLEVEGSFTRDISECLEFAKRYDELAYRQLHDLWQIVDHKVPMNLTEIKVFFRHYRTKCESAQIV